MLIAALAMVAGGATCRLEDARYVLRQQPSVIAGFRNVPQSHDWSAGVAFYIRSDKTKHTYWFLPFSGNGQGFNQHLHSAEDPGKRGWIPPDTDGPAHTPFVDLSLDYIAADAAYDFDQSFTMHRGVPAPAHLFIPNLQQAFWYIRSAPDATEGMPMSFFDFAGCDKAKG